MDNVENLSTLCVDNSPIPSACVDNVENLSTQNVDNSQFCELIAIMSYIYARVCGYVENLSTQNVDNSPFVVCSYIAGDITIELIRVMS